MLPASISDYSFNAMIDAKNNDEDDIEYSDETKSVSGYYRYGLTDQFTYGLNFQAQNKNSLSGIELSTSYSDLLFQGFITRSQFNEESSSSYNLRLQNNPDIRSERPIRLNASYRFFEKDFTYASGSINKVKTSKILGTSFILNSASSFGIGLEQREDYTEDKFEFINSEYIYRMNVNTNFSINSQIDVLESKNNSILISLNWFEPVKRKFSGYHSYNAQKQTSRNQVNYREKLGSKNLLISATHENSEKDDYKNTNALVNLDTNIGTLRVDHFDNTFSKINNVNLQFALVGTKSRPYLSRYINNAFVVIESESESPIQVGGELDSYVSKSNPVVVENLTVYQMNNIPLQLDQLAFGEDINYDHFTVEPTYLSGSHFKLKTNYKTSLGFRVISKNPDKIKYTNLLLMSDDVQVEVMSGKTGNIFIEDIPPGTYSLFIDDKLIKVIDIPDKTGYLQIGDINID